MNLSRSSVVALLLVSTAAFSTGCYVRAGFHGNPHGGARNVPAAPPPDTAPSTPPSLPGEPSAVAIRYDHFVDGHFNGHVDFQPERPGAQRGTMRNDSNTMTGTWILEGRHLVMTWPSESAPGGAYVDDVFFSADRALYEGRNNLGSAIIGERSSDPIVRPTEVPHPHHEEPRFPTVNAPIERRADGTCWQSPVFVGEPTHPMLLPAIQVRCG